VERRHHRTPVDALDIHRLRVYRNIRKVRGYAETIERGEKSRLRARQKRQEKRQRIDIGGKAHDFKTRKFRDKPARK